MGGRLKNLPPPIFQVMVPQLFSVSAIASTDSCLLKAIFQASAYEGVLSQGPDAIFGSVAHELLEKAVRGVRRTGGDTYEKLERILVGLLEETRKRLSGNPETAPYSDLPRTMTPLGWARKRRAILDMAYDSASRVRPFDSTRGSCNTRAFRFEKLLRDGQWAEVPIEVPELRLKGRMDVLNRYGRKVKIIDFKSGRVEDENGEIIERVVRQIRLYGLMANWLEPSTHVILTILAGVEHSIPFDAEIRNETLIWLRSRMDPLPPGDTVLCDSIAQVGPDCRWCGMRHQCVRYLREVPSLWGSNLEWKLPIDVWGTIERIDSNGDDLVNLTLLDAGGRQIKVFSLDETYIKGMHTGDRIWLFDLSASITDLRGMPWRYPINFYEIGDSKSDRAWSLQVFSRCPGGCPGVGPE